MIKISTTKRSIKKAVFTAFKPAIKLAISIFFDKKFIAGRYFEDTHVGYVWAIKSILQRNILRLGQPLPWPVGLTCKITDPNKITFHPDDLNNFQSPGTYIQNFKAHIYLGKGSYMAPNVGIITANHKIDNLDEHEEGKDVVIGEKCWIGMNSIVLPGVTLGNKTIVAAGSVVTKSFPQGHVVIGGAPARILKQL